MGRPPSDDPRATVSMRVPERTLKRIDAWADGEGMNRSDALRQIMQAGVQRLGILAEAEPAAPSGHPSGGIAAARDAKRKEGT